MTRDSELKPLERENEKKERELRLHSETHNGHVQNISLTFVTKLDHVLNCNPKQTVLQSFPKNSII